MNSNSNKQRKVFEKEVTENTLYNMLSKVFACALGIDIGTLICSIIFFNSWLMAIITIVLIPMLSLIGSYFYTTPAFTLTIEKSTLTYDSQNETIIFPLPCFIESGKDYITIIYNADCRHTIFCATEEEKEKIMEFLKDAI